MPSWKALVDGWGLRRVPREMTKELACCMCTRQTHRDLWTDQNPTYGTIKELRAAYERLRDRCWCRFHAEAFFGDQD